MRCGGWGSGDGCCGRVVVVGENVGLKRRGGEMEGGWRCWRSNIQNLTRHDESGAFPISKRVCGTW